jgi:hypothetical protein
MKIRTRFLCSAADIVFSLYTHQMMLPEGRTTSRTTLAP